LRHDNNSTSNAERTTTDVPRPRGRPRVAPTSTTPAVSTPTSGGPHPSMSLSDVLRSGEEVTMTVNTGKNDEGNFITTTVLASFDGTNLTVTGCDLVSSLVGTTSAKPGEILYKFIDGLMEGGHIKRKFSIAPWKLCSVVRDGQRRTLEQLRTVVG